MVTKKAYSFRSPASEPAAKGDDFMHNVSSLLTRFEAMISEEWTELQNDFLGDETPKQKQPKPTTVRNKMVFEERLARGEFDQVSVSRISASLPSRESQTSWSERSPPNSPVPSVVYFRQAPEVAPPVNESSKKNRLGRFARRSTPNTSNNGSRGLQKKRYVASETGASPHRDSDQNAWMKKLMFKNDSSKPRATTEVNTGTKTSLRHFMPTKKSWAKESFGEKGATREYAKSNIVHNQQMEEDAAGRAKRLFRERAKRNRNLQGGSNRG